MNGITGYMAQISQILHGGGLVWLYILAGAAVLLLLVWLLLRGLRLWYWKVNVHTDTLKNIDNKLQALSEEIKERPAFANDVKESEPEPSPEAEVEAQNAKPEGVYIVSKAGKIYTEEELEALIKD